jgi:4-hydroxy-3-methylbut-2-enyl diphosphate reductase IspH
MTDSSEKQVLKFLKELMEIQRRYGNELKNAKTNRQEEVRELVEKIVAKEVVDAD